MPVPVEPASDQSLAAEMILQPLIWAKPTRACRFQRYARSFEVSLVTAGPASGD